MNSSTPEGVRKINPIECDQYAIVVDARVTRSFIRKRRSFWLWEGQDSGLVSYKLECVQDLARDVDEDRVVAREEDAVPILVDARDRAQRDKKGRRFARARLDAVDACVRDKLLQGGWRRSARRVAEKQSDVVGRDAARVAHIDGERMEGREVDEAVRIADELGDVERCWRWSRPLQGEVRVVQPGAELEHRPSAKPLVRSAGRRVARPHAHVRHRHADEVSRILRDRQTSSRGSLSSNDVCYCCAARLAGVARPEERIHLQHMSDDNARTTRTHRAVRLQFRVVDLSGSHLDDHQRHTHGSQLSDEVELNTRPGDVHAISALALNHFIGTADVDYEVCKASCLDSLREATCVGAVTGVGTVEKGDIEASVNEALARRDDEWRRAEVVALMIVRMRSRNYMHGVATYLKHLNGKREACQFTRRFWIYDTYRRLISPRPDGDDVGEVFRRRRKNAIIHEQNDAHLGRLERECARGVEVDVRPAQLPEGLLLRGIEVARAAQGLQYIILHAGCALVPNQSAVQALERLLDIINADKALVHGSTERRRVRRAAIDVSTSQKRHGGCACSVVREVMRRPDVVDSVAVGSEAIGQDKHSRGDDTATDVIQPSPRP